MAAFDPGSISRPDPALMRYYTIGAAMTLIGFPFVILPLYFRYITLRYRFDDEGISMSVGLLFKKEVYLTYRRIQDIHISRGILQRWMGLATIAIQTASGSSSPEMTIEGMRDPDALRDFLYQRMRGARAEGSGAQRPDDRSAGGVGSAGEDQAAEGRAAEDEALALLHRIADAMDRFAAARGGGP